MKKIRDPSFQPPKQKPVYFPFLLNFIFPGKYLQLYFPEKISKHRFELHSRFLFISIMCMYMFICLFSM